jgi:hypothetical protein
MQAESKTHQLLTSRGDFTVYIYKRRTMASNTLFSNLLGEMEQAEQTRTSSGDTKRTYVLNALKSAGLVSDTNSDTVAVLIDMVIWLSRRPESLHAFRELKSSCGGCLPS